jgi:hypothetical protein
MLLLKLRGSERGNCDLRHSNTVGAAIMLEFSLSHNTQSNLVFGE